MAVARKKPAAQETEPKASIPDLGKERELRAYREMLQIRLPYALMAWAS